MFETLIMGIWFSSYYFCSVGTFVRIFNLFFAATSVIVKHSNFLINWINLAWTYT